MRTFDGPGKGLAKDFTHDGTTGLADGHQVCVSLLESTVVLEVAHQRGVRQDNEVHVPGLASPVPELTLAHAQLLLPVSVKGLCPCPASLVDLQDPVSFPVGAVGDEHLARLLGICLRPQHQKPHRMGHSWNANGLGEIPLGLTRNRELGPHQWCEGCDPIAHRDFLSTDYNRSVALQVANVAALFGVDVVQNGCIGEVAIEGEVAWDLFGNHPVNQFLGQGGVILEGAFLVTLVTLAEAAEVEWVVFAGT